MSKPKADREAEAGPRHAAADLPRDLKEGLEEMLQHVIGYDETDFMMSNASDCEVDYFHAQPGFVYYGMFGGDQPPGRPEQMTRATSTVFHWHAQFYDRDSNDARECQGYSLEGGYYWAWRNP